MIYNTITRKKQKHYNFEPELTSVFSEVRVTRSLVLCVCFVDRSLSFWPLCCLSFCDLRILITPLISANSSCYLQIFALDFERSKRQTLPTRSEHQGSTTVFGEVRVAHLFNCLCCVVFLLRLLFICLRHVLCVLHAAIVS